MDAVLYVVDLDRMTAFYRDALGLEPAGSHDGGADLLCAGSVLHLVQVPAAVAATIEIALPAERREETPIKLLLPVADVAVSARRAAAGGGQVDEDAQPWEWQGTLRLDVVDPEGNVVQLVGPA